MSSCFDGCHNGERYSSRLRMMDLYRHIIVSVDLSLNTDSTQAVSRLVLSTIVLICGVQVMDGVMLTPRSRTMLLGVILVPSVVVYSKY